MTIAIHNLRNRQAQLEALVATWYAARNVGCASSWPRSQDLVRARARRLIRLLRRVSTLPVDV